MGVGSLDGMRGSSGDDSSGGVDQDYSDTGRDFGDSSQADSGGGDSAAVEISGAVTPGAVISAGAVILVEEETSAATRGAAAISSARSTSLSRRKSLFSRRFPPRDRYTLASPALVRRARRRRDESLVLTDGFPTGPRRRDGNRSNQYAFCSNLGTTARLFAALTDGCWVSGPHSQSS